MAITLTPITKSSTVSVTNVSKSSGVSVTTVSKSSGGGAGISIGSPFGAWLWLTYPADISSGDELSVSLIAKN